MKNVILFFICTNSVFLFGQPDDIFSYDKSDNIDLRKEFVNLQSDIDISKIRIIGFIIDPQLSLTEEWIKSNKIDETWLSHFDVSRISANFFVVNPQESGSFNVNINYTNSLKKNILLKRSSLFIIVKDLELISYINKNLTKLSLGKTMELEEGCIFQLIDINSFEDFKWKTKQLLFNFSSYKVEPKVEIIENNNELGFQMEQIIQNNLTISGLNNKNFSGNSFGVNYVRRIPLKKEKSIGLGVGFDFSFQNFISQLPNQTEKTYYDGKVDIIDTITVQYFGIEEQNNLNQFKGYFNINYSQNIGKGGVSWGINLMPYLSSGKIFSTYVSGTLTTRGESNIIENQLIDIPSIGLNENSTEMIGEKSTHKMSGYGIKINPGIQWQNKSISFQSYLSFDFFKGNVTSNLLSIYDFKSNSYNGFFANQRSINMILLSLGLSIKYKF